MNRWWGAVGALVLLSAMTVHAPPPPPAAAAAVQDDVELPDAASARDRALQPLTDYDQDGCYPSFAISAGGVLAAGLQPGGSLSSGCRAATDLPRANTYVRTACDDGWCARMYAYYFKKDQLFPYLGGGHRHDIEHVIVWSREDAVPEFVSVSQHGAYETRPWTSVPSAGSQVKVVYHKDGLTTHAFRFATAADEPPENHSGSWHAPALVDVDTMSTALRAAMLGHDFGQARFDLTDERFRSVLHDNAPDGVPFD